MKKKSRAWFIRKVQRELQKHHGFASDLGGFIECRVFAKRTADDAEMCLPDLTWEDRFLNWQTGGLEPACQPTKELPVGTRVRTLDLPSFVGEFFADRTGTVEHVGRTKDGVISSYLVQFDDTSEIRHGVISSYPVHASG